MSAGRKRGSTTGATGPLLGGSVEDINSTIWLLGHDLKSPVSIIISAMEALVTLYEDDERMAEIMPLVRGSLAAANREHNMISDMLDLARFEIGQGQVNHSRLSITALLQETLGLEEYNLKSKQLRLTVEMPTDDPLETEVDSELFIRSVSAMVDNVLKFTVKDDRLTIRAGRLDGYIVGGCNVEQHQPNLRFERGLRKRVGLFAAKFENSAGNQRHQRYGHNPDQYGSDAF